jgi:hypothetical protein
VNIALEIHCFGVHFLDLIIFLLTSIISSKPVMDSSNMKICVLCKFVKIIVKVNLIELGSIVKMRFFFTVENCILKVLKSPMVSFINKLILINFGDRVMDTFNFNRILASLHPLGLPETGSSNQVGH